MRSIRDLFGIFAIGAALMLGATTDVFAQGKGRGGGNGRGGEVRQERQQTQPQIQQRGGGQERQIQRQQVQQRGGGQDRPAQWQQRGGGQNRQVQWQQAQQQSDRGAMRQQQRGGGQNRQVQWQQAQQRPDRGAMRQQQRSDMESRRQQQWSDRQAREQQRRSEMESRRQQRTSDRGKRGGLWEGFPQQQQRRSDSESRRQQQWSDRQAREQQRRSDMESRRQQRMSDRGKRGGLWEGFPQERNRRIDDRKNQVESENRSDRGRWNRAGNGTPPWANRNYETPAWAHQRRDERKAQKAFEKEMRRAERYNNPYVWDGWNAGRTIWDTPYYGDRYDRARYRDRDDWNDDWDDYDDRWDRYRTTYVYDRPTYVVNHYPFYGPVTYYNYDPYYYDPYPYYTPVYYSSYDPFYSSYYPRYVDVVEYYDDPYYYGDPYYDGSRYYYDRGDWKEQLLRVVLASFFGGSDYGYYDRYPNYYRTGYIPYRQPSQYYVISEPWYGGYYDDPYTPAYYSPDYYGTPYYTSGYDNDILRQAVAAGYYQGLQDGMYARQRGWDDSNYYDPYAYDGRYYDTYSTSIAERRRCMSDGYELGYRDAMMDRDAAYYYDDAPVAVDLVSLALGDVMRLGV